jgi:hypothetical protein
MSKSDTPATVRVEPSVRPRAGTAAYVRQAMRREAAYVTEVETLKAWIRNVGLQADICTRQVLREVCENCRCKHAPKGPNV